MPSKSQIKSYVLNNKTLTFKQLEDMVYNLEINDNPSNINPSLSRRCIVENIFKPFFEQLREKSVDFNSSIKTHKLNYRDKITLSSHGMIAVNILRECNFQLP